MTERKRFEDLTPDEVKGLKIEFAPGCFDNFEGTQEELDELVAEIHRMISSGEFAENSRPLDLEDLSEEEAEILFNALSDQENSTRKLQ